MLDRVAPVVEDYPPVANPPHVGAGVDLIDLTGGRIEAAGDSWLGLHLGQDRLTVPRYRSRAPGSAG